MTKYLIIVLFVVVIILSVIVVINSRREKAAQPPQVSFPSPTTSVRLPSPIPIISTEDQIKAQSEADLNFGKWAQDVNRNYPWYNQLPIQTEKYYVYFDLDLKKFIGRLYANGQQAENLKTEVMRRLSELGIDTSKYEFQWEIVPQ